MRKESSSASSYDLLAEGKEREYGYFVYNLEVGSGECRVSCCTSLVIMFYIEKKDCFWWNKFFSNQFTMQKDVASFPV